MPTFRDFQIVRRNAGGGGGGGGGGDYQEGEDLETFLSHHPDTAEPDDVNDDDCEYENDGIIHNNHQDDDEDDDDPTIRYKRLYYSLRRRSQFLPFLLGYLVLGSFVIGVLYVMTRGRGMGSYFKEPLDVDGGVTHYQHRLKLSDIHHWCHDRSLPRSKCRKCHNPLYARSRHEKEHWTETHESHVQSVNRWIMTTKTATAITTTTDHVAPNNVIFLGDSITEGWMGKSYGQDRDYKQDNIPVFHELFGSQNDFPALPLGIAGDQSPNLLWRIQHGEVSEQLTPWAFWILIGTNDFNKDASCSSEVVTMGIQRVVEEMIVLKPNSKIIVNSLLPRATDHPQGWLVELDTSKNNDNDHEDDKTNNDKNDEGNENKNNPHHRQLATTTSKNDASSPPVSSTSTSSSSTTTATTTSLWRDIQKVNHALERYVQELQNKGNNNVYFFNATGLLIREHDELHSNYYIPTEYMPDFLHPNAMGYRLWGQAMIQFLKHIQP